MKYLYILITILIIQSCQKENQTPPVSKATQTAQNDNENQKKKSILFFGDSLTAGYGLEESEAFPSLIQDRIDSLRLPYKVINAGLSGETSAGGKGRIDWVLAQQVDLFVLELGANDVLRGLPLAQTRENLDAILSQVQLRYPDAKLVIAGMMAPPNMGAQYGHEFASIFAELAQKYSAGLIPFLLDGVAGDPKLNLPDGIHPNAKGQHIVKENVWTSIKSLL